MAKWKDARDAWNDAQSKRTKAKPKSKTKPRVGPQDTPMTATRAPKKTQTPGQAEARLGEPVGNSGNSRYTRLSQEAASRASSTRRKAPTPGQAEARLGEPVGTGKGTPPSTGTRIKLEAGTAPNRTQTGPNNKPTTSTRRKAPTPGEAEMRLGEPVGGGTSRYTRVSQEASSRLKNLETMAGKAVGSTRRKTQTPGQAESKLGAPVGGTINYAALNRAMADAAKAQVSFNKALEKLTSYQPPSKSSAPTPRQTESRLGEPVGGSASTSPVRSLPSTGSRGSRQQYGIPYATPTNSTTPRPSTSNVSGPTRSRKE